MQPAPAPDLAHQRLTQVFQFLEALNQIRNPAVADLAQQEWKQWLGDLPDHPLVSLRTSADDADTVPVLRVGRPEVTHPPEPPSSLQEWCLQEWRDFGGKVTLRESLNRTGEDGQLIIERFDSSAERVKDASAYRTKWEEWHSNETPARASLTLFEGLFELHGRLQREGEAFELVLGDGILLWQAQSVRVSHPILLCRVQLNFDAHKPEFTVTEAEMFPALYWALLRTIAPPESMTRLAQASKQIEELGLEVLGGSDTAGFFRSFVQQLSAQGRFHDSPVTEATSSPQLFRKPVLFLRKRNLGYASAIQSVIADLSKGKPIAPGLVNIVDPSSTTTILATDSSSQPETALHEQLEILFSKEANQEQFDIAERLHRRNSVLVQGPPGTGKTHTIANLVGHLLAQGKSILVTSHSTKALRVVRNQVVSELQPLCVSVLERDQDSQEQLKHSVAGMAERLSTDDAEALSKRAALLRSERIGVVDRLAALKRNVLRSRSNEYQEIVVGGQGISPLEAARFVQANEHQHSWIPAPVEHGVSLPLSETELSELYAFNAEIDESEERELSNRLPTINDLVMPSEFAEWVAELDELQGSDLTSGIYFWKSDSEKSLASTDLEALRANLHQVARLVREDTDNWIISVIADGRIGGGAAQAWVGLVSSIRKICELAGNLQESLFKFGPTLPTDCSPAEAFSTIQEIEGHVAKGGSLNFLTLMTKPRWKALIPKCSVQGKQPQSLSDFQVLRKFADLQMRREELRFRWKTQVEPSGAIPAKDLGEQPERTSSQFCDLILQGLDWPTKSWEPMIDQLQKSGFDWNKFFFSIPPNVGPHGDVRRIATAAIEIERLLDVQIRRNRLLGLREKLSGFQTMLAGYATPSTQKLRMLLGAVKAKNCQEYEDCFSLFLSVLNKQSALQRRLELLAKLRMSAPGWAAVIADRIEPHHRQTIPGAARPAWQCRQYHDEIARRHEFDLDAAVIEIERFEQELKLITAKLIDALAWSQQIARTSKEQRQALVGWQDVMRKIGKGTGKRVPVLLSAAKELMNKARTAVPVWIMPISRVVENFNPGVDKFDVVIVDEASQCDLMGLLVLYMGKELVVVGDHEQVSPDAVGQSVDQTQKLIQAYLNEVPNSVLYDGQASIYDLARQSFDGLIRLREHFRCAPAIIQFSNILSYDGQIKPLRDDNFVTLKPAVVAHRCHTDAVSHEKQNLIEAQTVASLVIAAAQDESYAGKTFGIISMVGDYQALLIEKLLRSKLHPRVFDQRQIVCGNPAHFQGDERDVMFLSMVDGCINPPLSLREEPRFKKRFNVAASRARDQMWVVHSLNPDTDLKENDLRKRLIQHAQDPKKLMEALEQAAMRAQSEFELQVHKRLLAKGYQVRPQWKVGGYSIDMVVEGRDAKLAVECDGDRYHNLDNIESDMEREAILRRLGWTFHRLRGTEFFRSPDATMLRLFDRLERMGIEQFTPTTSTPSNAESVDRIIRSSELIRADWAATDILKESVTAVPSEVQM